MLKCVISCVEMLVEWLIVLGYVFLALVLNFCFASFLAIFFYGAAYFVAGYMDLGPVDPYTRVGKLNVFFTTNSGLMMGIPCLVTLIPTWLFAREMYLTRHLFDNK